MRPLRVGLDLDGVIVNSVQHWITVLNREAGTTYRPGDLPDTYGTPEMAAVSERHELQMLIAPGPMPGAAAALQQLRAHGHELVVITARHPRLRTLTEAWLSYHGIAVDRLHFLEGAPKAPTAVAEGLDLMVEDTPQHAFTLAAAGVPVLLFAAPYNAGVDHPLIRRPASWPEALQQVQQIAGGAARFGA